MGGTPKAPSIVNGFGPPSQQAQVPGNGNTQQQDDESARLRERLAEAEARAQRRYEEMGEYKSWLQQVEERGTGNIERNER